MQNKVLKRKKWESFLRQSNSHLGSEQCTLMVSPPIPPHTNCMHRKNIAQEDSLEPPIFVLTGKKPFGAQFRTLMPLNLGHETLIRTKKIS